MAVESDGLERHGQTSSGYKTLSVAVAGNTRKVDVLKNKWSSEK